MDEKLAKEVFSDKEFVKSLLLMETAEEVQAALKEKGVDLTVEDILQIREMCGRADAEELSEEELENVAGGICPAVIVLGFFGIINLVGFVHEATNRRW